MAARDVAFIRLAAKQDERLVAQAEFVECGQTTKPMKATPPAPLRRATGGPDRQSVIPPAAAANRVKNL
jgi:hypothetical protein